MRSFSIGVENEDDEWEARLKQTGAAGRLVIYELGEEPRDDILLRGGSGRRIVVTAVNESGRADRAGVKAGDTLVSINGKKDFIESSADVVHASLKAPVLLVFMGFVGKLQAEVRLNYAETVAGMSLQDNVLASRRSDVRLYEEVVFQPSANAPLFLTTEVQAQQTPSNNVAGMPRPVVVPDTDDAQLQSEPSGDMAEMIGEMIGTGVASSSSEAYNHAEPLAETGPATEAAAAAIYEVHVADARYLVRNALNRMRAPSSQAFDGVESSPFPYTTDVLTADGARTRPSPGQFAKAAVMIPFSASTGSFPTPGLISQHVRCPADVAEDARMEDITAQVIKEMVRTPRAGPSPFIGSSMPINAAHRMVRPNDPSGDSSSCGDDPGCLRGAPPTGDHGDMPVQPPTMDDFNTSPDVMYESQPAQRGDFAYPPDQFQMDASLEDGAALIPGM